MTLHWCPSHLDKIPTEMNVFSKKVILGILLKYVVALWSSSQCFNGRTKQRPLTEERGLEGNYPVYGSVFCQAPG